MEGKLIIISGASGAGKDTIVSKILENNPNAYKIRTSTTRQPRNGEINGCHYDFLEMDDFTNKIQSNYFIEHANVHGNYYGTPLESVLNIQDDHVALWIVDVQGAALVMPKLKHAMTVFINVPSLSELENRLRKRKLDSEEVIEKRLKNAEIEMKSAQNYQYIIVNDILDIAVQNLQAIIDK